MKKSKKILDATDAELRVAYLNMLKRVGELEEMINNNPTANNDNRQMLNLGMKMVKLIGEMIYD